jgi:TELO2-interacting protein 1
LADLFNILQRAPKGAASLVDVSAVPTLAHCLTVVLKGITDGPSSEVQLGALLALKAIWTCIKDQQALSAFLPGTISALTKCLMPSTKVPRSRRVLISALDVFQTALTTVVGDIRTRNLEGDGSAFEASSKTVSTQLTKAWLKATGAQIKLALANVVKLRKHEHHDVRKALEKMCLVILDECHASLMDSAALLVETSMTLASLEEEGETSRTACIKDLAMIYPSISDLIKSITHNWALGLPRVMQSNDESQKQSSLHQLTKSQRILLDLGITSEVLDNALTESLRNSVVSLLELSDSPKTYHRGAIEDAGPALMPTNEAPPIKPYSPLLIPHESQARTREQLGLLISGLGPPETQIKIASQILQQLRSVRGSNLVASFWLSFQLLRAATASSFALSDYINLTIESPNSREATTVELYDFALSVLNNTEDDRQDWRVVATGLEVVAYVAGCLGEDFRSDLVNTIYPVVQLLGSSNGSLRDHAITTLNMISNSCGYQSTSAMIVDNADYLINTISLRLNNFDISPQAPQVIMMMMRLSGPSLLPYLDDVVASIFAALDNFHGYPRLVETLFSVLGEIVLQSGKSEHLSLTAESVPNHHKVQPKASTIKDVATSLTRSKSRAVQRRQTKHEEFPREPWIATKVLLDEGGCDEGLDAREEESIQRASPTKVYKMVQNITRLGQHYLTNPSPLLRRQLLDLIGTANDVLRLNEDEFLPLVNDIWPVLIRRLYDEEPFVVMSASRAIGEICRCAGDFMSTRIEVEWRNMIELAKEIRTKANAEKKGRNGRGIYSLNSQVWESIIKLLITIIEYVHIGDDAFDEVLELLGGLLSSRGDVRSALSVINADAVWLYEYERGQQLNVAIPMMEEYTFVSVNP